LFRNRPDLLTRGRFYFVPPGTPHYPGFHNQWSADWTYSYGQETDSPPLGEDRYARLGYSLGSLGVAYPAVTRIGEASCVESGEVYPQQNGERTLIAGIDSRCWSSAGLAVPDQIPALKLEASSLPSASPTTIDLWRDTSPYANHARRVPGPAEVLVVDTLGQPKAAAFAATAMMALDYPLRMQGDGACYAVIWPVNVPFMPQTSAFPFGQQGLNDFALMYTWFQNRAIGDWVSYSHDGLGWWQTWHLIGLRRQAGVLTVRFDGTTLAPISNSDEGTLTIDRIGGGAFPGILAGPWVTAELRVYLGSVSAEQDEVIADYLRITYSLP